MRSTPPRSPTSRAALRHLLGLAGMSAGELRALLSASRDVPMEGPIKGLPLAGKIVANLFFEDSTRTRTSFGIAARRLGAEVVDLMGFASSVNKGETLIDTAMTIEAMGVSVLVVRARQSGAAGSIAANVDCSVINAGDGRHEHPTQGLLDILTLAERFGREQDFDLSGLRVAIVGDVNASRVARSAIFGMTTLGARVVCVGPPGMASGGLASLAPGMCAVTHDLDAALPETDAVMMLRIQHERYGEAKAGEKSGGGSAPIASLREFHEFYALTRERAGRMKPGAIVMHPGPMNRGVEIDEEVADGERSVILRQVANGVRVRVAVLGWACSAKTARVSSRTRDR